MHLPSHKVALGTYSSECGHGGPFSPNMWAVGISKLLGGRNFSIISRVNAILLLGWSS